MRSILRKLMVSAACLAAVVIIVPQRASATIVAYDVATNSPYSDGWQSGDNGGFGFSSWVNRTTSGFQDGFNGQFIGSSRFNGSGGGAAANGIDVAPSSGVSFGEYGNTSNFAVGFRGFGAALTPGRSTFSLQMDNGFIDSGNSVGFTIRNGNSNSSVTDYNSGARFEFLFQGGDGSYKYIDGTGTHFTGIGFTSDGLTLAFTLTGLDTYSLVVSNGQSTALLGTFSGTLGGTAGTFLNSFAAYNLSAGGGGSNDAFFNQFQVDTVVPEPTMAAMLGLGGFVIWLRRKRGQRA